MKENLPKKSWEIGPTQNFARFSKFVREPPRAIQKVQKKYWAQRGPGPNFGPRVGGMRRQPLKFWTQVHDVEPCVQFGSKSISGCSNLGLGHGPFGSTFRTQPNEAIVRPQTGQYSHCPPRGIGKATGMCQGPAPIFWILWKLLRNYFLKGFWDKVACPYGSQGP